MSERCLKPESNFESFCTQLGLVFFSFFLVLAVVFFKESTTRYDYSMELVGLLNGHDMVSFRWGAKPWRVFALLGPTLNLSLKTILVGTSTLFVLLKFFGWLICHKLLKNPTAGLLVIGTTVIGISDGYYVQSFQAYNAILYFCLFFAILTSPVQRMPELLKLVVLIVLAFLVLKTYVVIYAFCLLVSVITLIRNYQKWSNVVLIISLLVVLFASMANVSEYEADVYGSILDNLKTKNLVEFKGLFFFYFKNIVSLEYGLPLLAFSITFWTLIKARRYLEILVSITFYLVLFLLTLYSLSKYHTGYPYTELSIYYVQGTFYALALTPLVLFFYWNAKSIESLLYKSSFRIVTVAAIVFYSSLILSSGIKKFEYTVYLEALIKTLRNDYAESVFVVEKDLFPPRFARFNFALHQESVLLSSLNPELRTISIYSTSDTNQYRMNNEYPVFLNRTEAFQLPPFDIANPSSYDRPMSPGSFFKDYNKQYFNFTDAEFKILNHSYMNRFHSDYGFPASEY